MEELDIKTQKNREACKRWRDKNKEREAERNLAYRRANKDKVNEWNRNWRAKNPDKWKASQLKSSQTRNYSCETHLLHGARDRAKQKGLDFDLTISDIIIPELCPVFDTPLIRPDTSHPEYNRDFSPTIDRVDSTRGYTRDNIRIISFRANTLKNNGTLQELEAIVAYIKEHSKHLHIAAQ